LVEAEPRSEKEEAVIAYHEAGHVVAAMVLPEARTALEATIIPRSKTEGVVFQHHSSRVITKAHLVAEQMVALAGIASEEIKFGTPSTGNGSDLARFHRLMDVQISTGM